MSVPSFANPTTDMPIVPHEPYRELASEVVLLAIADARSSAARRDTVRADFTGGGLDHWIALLGWSAQEEDGLRDHLAELLDDNTPRRSMSHSCTHVCDASVRSTSQPRRAGV